MKPAQQWIDQLKLEPHPEGGWFRRVYASDLKTAEGRPLLTSIYYLLEAADFSALHRLKSDEQWCFHAGAPITIHEINVAGNHRAIPLGRDAFQHVVRAGTLFGATVASDYALVSCSVVPGFDFAEFEMPRRAELLAEYPSLRELVARLTRD